MELARSGTPPSPRARQWLRRYAPAEVAALLGAVLAATVVTLWWADGAVSAFAGSIGEGAAFYGFLLMRDVRGVAGGLPARVGVVLPELLYEFGPAELVDTLAVRPLAMYAGQVALASTVGGVIAGKVAADVVFYGIAIGCVELRRRWRPGTRTVRETSVPATVVVVPAELVLAGSAAEPARLTGAGRTPVPTVGLPRRSAQRWRSRPRSRRSAPGR